MYSLAYRLLIIFTVIALPLVAEATRVTVDVRLPDGSRAGPGVTVTVNRDGVLTASPPTATTDRQSRARFGNIAEGRAIIVATRNGARGEWSGQIRGKNQNVQVRMEFGLISTAPATAPSEQETNGDPAPSPDEGLVGVTNTTSVDPTPDPPQIVMQIDSDAECTARDEVRLDSRLVSGPLPNYYRASESSSFAGATWRSYVANPRFALSGGSGPKRVYFQVRAVVDANGTALDSNVVSDVIERVASNARATLAINSGAGTTYANTVTLNNTASFDGGGSNPRYIASESPQFTGAQWQAYSTAPSFTLSEGAGTKTVYFMATQEVCGTVVGTPVVSDAIALGEVSAVSVTVGTTGTTSTEPVDASGSTAMTPDPSPADMRAFEFRSYNTGASLTSLPIAGDAAKFASQNGFMHTASRIAGSGQCKLAYEEGDHTVNPTLYALAVPTVDNTTGTLVNSLICEFRLFGSRRLSPGWRVTGVKVTDLAGLPDGKWTGTVDIVNSPSGDNLATVVRINVPAYHCGSLLDGLELCPSPPFVAPIGFTPSVFESKWTLGGFLDYLGIEGPSTDWRDAFKR